ncbi:MAG: hypothetical protein CL566_03005 [Alphaproteobacteria bacterium]|nr:hypothetical protein [Alphaproteobacteria bacterium]
MSEDIGERTQKADGRTVVPWIVAFVLFLVLAGLAAAVGIGLTTDPVAEPFAESPEPASPDSARWDPPATAPESDPPQEPAVAAATDGEPGRDTAETMETPEPAPPAATDGEPGRDTTETMETPEPAPPAETAAPAVKPSPAPETTVATAPPPPPVPEALQTGRSLVPAPDPALVERSSFGALPRIGPNGREPWQVYARPEKTPEDRPRVAVIVSGLGLSSAATEAAIQELPGEVTLAFQPFADNIQQWIRLARAAGHEVLLNVPMEPIDFPESDPGPRALFVTLSPDENEERLRWALSRVAGYVGVLNHMGSRFTTSRESMQPVLAELKARGLLYVDARASARSVATVMASEMGVPRAINDRFLDAREVSRVTIDARLSELERIAQEAGVSIAIGQAFPVTIERIREWSKTLKSRGLSLVPVSAVVDRQADR